MEKYIGTKMIHAEPGNAPKDSGVHHEGTPGMRVQYEDGYTSWSPQEAFDVAYRKCDNMNFGLAMEAMIKGLSVERAGWNGNGMTLQAQMPDAGSKMTHPYLFMIIPGCEEGTRALPWQPAQVDVFATDWKICTKK